MAWVGLFIVITFLSIALAAYKPLLHSYEQKIRPRNLATVAAIILSPLTIGFGPIYAILKVFHGYNNLIILIFLVLLPLGSFIVIWYMIWGLFRRWRFNEEMSSRRPK
jgi:hypothetical protein